MFTYASFDVHVMYLQYFFNLTQILYLWRYAIGETPSIDRGACLESFQQDLS